MRAITLPFLRVLLLGTLAAPELVQAMDCSPAAVMRPLRPTILAPVASELAVVGLLPGMPQGVLVESADASQSVDQVLLRIRIASCQNMATIAPATGEVLPGDPAAYKPRTQFDNTPWRFNMSQNGKKMTAYEFSAWMKARGVRVARGAGAAALPAQSSDAAGNSVPVGTLPPPAPPRP